MEKNLVEFHPSVVVAVNKDKFLMTVYDMGYPQRAYRGKPNTPGGNPTIKDKTPLDTLEREVNEEFNKIEKPFGFIEDWASDKEISLIRESILKNIEPIGDYFVKVNSIGKPEEKMNIAGQGIFSVFYSNLPKDALECAEYLINTRKRFVTEGYEGVFTFDHLIKIAENDKLGISSAHLTPIILNDLYNPMKNIPSKSNNIFVLNKGPVRDSYEDYLNDSSLEHKESWLKY